MEVKVYKPESPVLRKYIECFYTLKRRPEEQSSRYAAFPGVYSMLCLHLDTKMEKAGNVRTFSYQPNDRIETHLICNFGHHEQICYKGKADEIVIYFKPLGLNAFLENDLRDYLSSYFIRFEPFENYQKAMHALFELTDDTERIRALENYWLTKLKGFEHPFLQDAVDEILSEKASVSLTELARRYEISRTTLIKHFNLHLCTTPSQFKKIVRFRNAMKRQQDNSLTENLTGISTEANYFDQSHMIKDFKSLTQYSPKDFFSKISRIENGQVNWMFL